MDIDGFERIVEIHGRQLGDQLLRAVSERLAGAVDAADTVARFSDDKFVILCEDMNSPVDVESVARRVDAALLEPFALTGADRPVALTASIGVVFEGSGNSMSNDLVEKADKAMSNAMKTRDAPHQLIDLRATLATRATEPARRTT